MADCFNKLKNIKLDIIDASKPPLVWDASGCRVVLGEVADPETVFAAFAGDGIDITAGGTNGHAPTIAHHFWRRPTRRPTARLRPKLGP
jgi:hypothetical protein